MNPTTARELPVAIGTTTLQGVLRVPRGSRGIVLFAHGNGSGRLSPRNTYVAERLSKAGLATLLFDLLTSEEEAIDSMTAEVRFDIPLLTDRLVAATCEARLEIVPHATHLFVEPGTLEQVALPAARWFEVNL